MALPKEFAERFIRTKLLSKRPCSQFFLAIDKKLGNREVALKVFPRVAELTEQSRAAYLEEGEKLRRASHGMLTPIIHVGIESQYCFLAMELLEGPNLQQYLDEEGKLVVDHALQIFLDIAAGVAELHAEGSVHGHLDPFAIIFKGSEPRVAGYVPFAIEGMLFGQFEGGARFGVERAYLAPEIHSGFPQLDPSCDIFSLSVLLFEMLSKQLPYSLKELEARVGSPPVLEELPRELSRALTRGLSLQVEGRFRSVEEMIREIKPSQKRVFNPYVKSEQSLSPPMREVELEAPSSLSPIMLSILCTLLCLLIMALAIFA